MKKSYEEDVTAWKRPSEIDGDVPSLWGSEGIKPRGINQGALGDCWFLAATAAIAENPERIQRIFTNKEYPSNGVFELNLYQRGKPVKEIIDDRLPINSYGMPVNSQKSPLGAWWVPILEKAFAKMHVNYANLDGGYPDTALRELTGMPTKSYNVLDQSNEEFFKIVSHADAKNWIMVGACMKEEYGLVGFHAYTLLGVVDLKTDGESVQRLIKLRNPWGVEMYTGDWNDNDSRWTDDFKAQAKLVQEDDGIFHMPLENYRNAF